MARLFAAIELDAQTRELVARAQRRLAVSIRTDSLRWMRPEQWHLTLVFAAAIPAEQVDAVDRAMSEDVSRAPFRLELAGFGTFPPRGAPRVLWLGVRGGADSVVAVQREIAQRFKDLGVPLEQRPFHPHLTLARWKAPGGRLRGLDSSPEPIAEFHVDHVALIESHVSSNGPTYTVRTLARLANPGAGLH
jgi:2'-5' RNA ligase